MRAWLVARSIFDIAPLCERSERADNKLDKAARLPSTTKPGEVGTPGKPWRDATLPCAHGPSRAASSMLPCERSERADNRLDKTLPCASKRAARRAGAIHYTGLAILAIPCRGVTRPARGSKLTLRSNGRRISSVKQYPVLYVCSSHATLCTCSVPPRRAQRVTLTRALRAQRA